MQASRRRTAASSCCSTTTPRLDRGWLAELASVSRCRTDVGAVGPLLAVSGRLVQSAGVLLGVNRTATSALAGFRADDPVVRAWCASRRRVSAVLGACLADRARQVPARRRHGRALQRLAQRAGLLPAAGGGRAGQRVHAVRSRRARGRGDAGLRGDRRGTPAPERRGSAVSRALGAVCSTATDPAHHPALARTAIRSRSQRRRPACCRARAGGPPCEPGA